MVDFSYLCPVMNQKQILLGISSVQHFLVDGLCICCMYLLAPAYAAELTLSAFLTYNVIAFMSQPFTGMLADRMQHRHWLLLSSVVLLSLAVALASLSGRVPFGLSLVAVLLGIGNSLFHVWGGKQTVVKVGNDIRALGVFVSTGAFGLAVGLVCCSWTLLYVFLLAVVFLSVAYVRYDTQPLDGDRDEADRSVPVLPQRARLWLQGLPLLSLWMVVVLLMLFVAYRSFAGELFSKGISKSQLLILVIGATSMLGKMAGGWIACRVGIFRTLAYILAGVALCFLFRGDYVTVLLLGVFLMNCTMPVTLYLANEVLKQREGLAFGLLAAALIPGWWLAVYG